MTFACLKYNVQYTRAVLSSTKDSAIGRLPCLVSTTMTLSLVVSTVISGMLVVEV